MKIGIIGCGKFSSTHLRLADQFLDMTSTACADLNPEVARAQGDVFGIRAMSVERLLADPDIELILNLTIPSVHAEVSAWILEASKHVYSEKLFVLAVEQGQGLQTLADERGLRIGSAPDTFLGGAHQRSRALIDSGNIGAAIAGGRPHRCYGQLALHVVDIMTSCLRSAEQGVLVALSTTCARPDALDAVSARAQLA